MKYIDPCFIEPLLNKYQAWFETLQRKYTSSHAAPPSGFTPSETAFWDFVVKHMLPLIRMKQNEMVDFVNEINKSYPFVYSAEKQIKSIQTRRGRYSGTALAEVCSKINQILTKSGCHTIVRQNSIRDMKEDALRELENIFNQKKVFDEIEQLFDYGKFYQQWGAEFIKNSGVETCPYCERAFIAPYNEKKSYTAQLDHFFPKGKYPFFALSLYNLIPCCSFCNWIKQAEDFYEKKHLYPYSEDIENKLTFTIEEKESNLDYSQVDLFSIGIEIHRDGQPASANVKTFKLKELYQSHKQTVANMAKLKRINTKHLRGELGRLTGDLDDTYIQSLFEALCLPSRANGILNKFIKDISEELNQKMGL